MCLGRHLVPVLTTCARRRWSYVQRCPWRGRRGVMHRQNITRHGSPGQSKTSMILGMPLLRTPLCGMSAHTAGQSSSPPPNPSPLLMISRQTSPRRPMLSPRCSRSCLATTKSRKHVARKVRKRLGQKGAETRGRLQWPRCPLRHADSSCASPRLCAKIPTICFWTPRVHSMKYTSSTQMSVKRGGPAFGPMFLWACQLMP